METIAEIRARLLSIKNAGTGSICPCCDQHSQIYERRITGAMVRQLLELYRHGSRTSRQLLSCVGHGGGGDHAKLRYWGLAEQLEGAKGEINSRWGICEKGVLFLERKLNVPEIAYIYNGELLEYSDKVVSVDDRMNKKFDYAELMGVI